MLEAGWRGLDSGLDSGSQLCAKGVEPAVSGPSSSQLASAQRDSCAQSLGMIFGLEVSAQSLSLIEFASKLEP
jgi:hypothetical protein